MTPEGERVLGDTTGHFNKGAFHLALSLGAPIVPLYIHTPLESNPGVSWHVPKGGTVTVSVLPALNTSLWEINTVKHHAAHVRDIYVQLYERDAVCAVVPRGS